MSPSNPLWNQGVQPKCEQELRGRGFGETDGGSLGLEKMMGMRTRPGSTVDSRLLQGNTSSPGYRVVTLPAQPPNSASQRKHSSSLAQCFHHHHKNTRTSFHRGQCPVASKGLNRKNQDDNHKCMGKNSDSSSVIKVVNVYS